jgi:hypothetical protein
MENEKLNNLSREVYPLTLKATTLICRPNPPVVTPLGNGVLLEINQTYYILSAGHLMNIDDFPYLMIPAKDNKMALCNGKLVTTYMNYSDKNKVDLAVFKFSERQNKHIEGHYRFIRPDEILLEHKTVETSSYIISGYPINNIIKHTGQPFYEAEPLQVLTATVRNRTYKKFGFNTSTHILVKLYGRIKPFLSNHKKRLKNPTGISGSGLWHIPNWNKLDGNGVPEHFLVGILTDNYIDQGFVVAVKIDFATEIIRHDFNIASKQSNLENIPQNIKKVYVAQIP